MTTPDDMDAVENEAAEWVVRYESGLTPASQVEFERWLAASPRHFAAFAEMDSALGVLNRPRELGARESAAAELASWELKRHRTRGARWRRIWIGVGLTAAAMIVLGFIATRMARPLAPAPSLATVKPRSERQQLPDGSVVELNAGAEIALNFTAARRNVSLVRGEAHFSVTKNAARPFVVTVGNVEVRAVGTEFAVRLDPKEVGVLVTEGRVAVSQAVPAEANSAQSTPPPPDAIYVSAGYRLAVPSDGSVASSAKIELMTPVDVNAALAWREMRFEFTNTPLAEAIELFNRKSGVTVVLGDASLANLRVSGIYWADNPDGFARLLETSMDIQSERDAQGRIVLFRKR